MLPSTPPSSHLARGRGIGGCHIFGQPQDGTGRFSHFPTTFAVFSSDFCRQTFVLAAPLAFRFLKARFRLVAAPGLLVYFLRFLRKYLAAASPFISADFCRNKSGPSSSMKHQPWGGGSDILSKPQGASRFWFAQLRELPQREAVAFPPRPPA